MQILTSVRNERSLHRSKRRNPTTRSWIPPRTFLAQVRFLRSREKSPRPGPPTPPPDRKTRGKKGKKAALRAGFPDGPTGRPAAPRQHRRKRPAAGQTRPSGGPESGPENRPRDHLKPREATAPPRRKYRGIPPRPARRTVGPARAEDPVQDLQPAPGARRRTPPPRRGPGQDPDAGGSHTPSRGREKKDAPASPRFADQLREEESNSQQPAPPEGRSSESSDQ